MGYEVGEFIIHFVRIHECGGRTDRQTDRQTDRRTDTGRQLPRLRVALRVKTIRFT